MLTPRISRCLTVLGLVASVVVCGSARAQTPTPTPTPNGQFLCSLGPLDGQPCNSDVDCGAPGVCVIAPGICDGGSGDGTYCDCAGGTCVASTPVCDPTFTGICQGGQDATQCCDMTTNCADSAACIGTQKVCLGGDSKASSCLHDSQCPGSSCVSTGKFCNGGDFDSFACVDDEDCNNADGSPGGNCLSLGQATPTPTATVTPAACVGDCDGGGDVTVNEIIIMVNIALGTQNISACPVGDVDGSGDITVNEIIVAVNNALLGCNAPTPTATATPNGEFLCSAGPRDGEACNGDTDCSPGGVCVIPQGVCAGGGDDTLYCGCPGGTCTLAAQTCDPTLTGVCVGGPTDSQCCYATDDMNSGYVANCADSALCISTPKVCLGGENKGVSCLNDAVCTGSSCQSTGRYCNGGDFDGYSCVDANDCLNVDGSSVGTCDGATTSALVPVSASLNACLVAQECPA